MIGRADDLTGAMVSIELEHERVHAGRTFQIHYKSPDASPIADDGTIDILIVTTTIPVHLMFNVTGGGNLETVFYENTEVSSNGSQMAVIGMNRHRSISPLTTAYLNPVITNVGDELFDGFDSRGVGLSTPEARPGTEWVLRRDTNYLIRGINRAGGARDMAIVAQWYQALGG